MINEKIWIKIRSSIRNGYFTSEKKVCGFYGIYIMLPGDPMHPENKYMIEYHSRYALEIRKLFRAFDEWVLLKLSHLTYKDRQDYFECYCLYLDAMIFDHLTTELTNHEVLLDLLDAFRSLMNEDVETVRAYVNRRAS